jgi:anti-anti-sigma factor
MEIHHKQVDHADVVEIIGDVNAGTVPELEQLLRTIIYLGRFYIIVDLRKCRYIGSSGLKLLISYANNCRRLNRGDVYLLTPPAPIMNLLNITGLVTETKSFFKMFDTLDEALLAVADHRAKYRRGRM